jgi:V8-like Glu-specific endopeptidase
LRKSNAHKTQANELRHELTTLPGNSGSPIIVMRGEGFAAIAIHQFSPNNIENVGRLITDDLLLNLLKWEK